ncbi:extracellular solute-binding protein [Corticibacter populi]|uniref:Extracellular solute-binding protein n=1 Tax=Corticibacter populi TaxID=1550736 RepID=A0A3M6R144_9BURK|nr:ABC transporter substrate-binding protein [Corticibacter populi]RMX08619.1 extracellular solute-binding protein [Corticibacter populi]RZS35949.1 iron(III) transport system substrate-binding protein [Corticibacter populi]
MPTLRTFLPALMAVATLATTAANAQTITLYTSQPNADAQATVDAFMAQNPGIKVEWVRDGTTQLLTRLEAEISANAVKPDVLLIADAVTLESLKQRDLLQPYQSPERTHYDAALYDADGYYHGTKLITTGIAYHQAAPQRPTSWQDLTRPEYRGLVAAPSPLYSGAALIHLQTLVNLPQFGWPYYEALKANGAQVQGGNGGVLKAVATGTKPYGVLADYLAIREKAKGAPVEFVFPTEGVSVVTEPVAILKGSAQPAARKLVDFLLSETGQQLVFEQGYLPARQDAPVPAGFPARDAIQPLPLDAARALQQTEADKTRFGQIFDSAP